MNDTPHILLANGFTATGTLSLLSRGAVGAVEIAIACCRRILSSALGAPPRMALLLAEFPTLALRPGRACGSRASAQGIAPADAAVASVCGKIEAGIAADAFCAMPNAALVVMAVKSQGENVRAMPLGYDRTDEIWVETNGKGHRKEIRFFAAHGGLARYFHFVDPINCRTFKDHAVKKMCDCAKP